MNTDLISLVLNLGSISGLLALPYSIAQAMKRKPKIKYDFIASAGGIGRKESSIDFYNLTFSGTLKNRSTETNTIIKIYLVVWTNNKRNSVLRYGHGGVVKIEDEKKTELKLPVTLKPKEAKKIDIFFEIPLTGTVDEKILREVIPISKDSYLTVPKHKYELCFEDVEENIFDQRGTLINMEEINLNWTIGNTVRHMQDGNFSPFIKHVLFTIYSRIKFIFKLLFYHLGI